MKRASRASAKKRASPGVPDRKGRVSANEAAAVASLRQYLAAQNRFRGTDHYGRGECVYANPSDGAGFADLHRLPGGKKLDLIDSEMARATTADKARTGYWFANIAADRAGREYDYVVDHGLCAVPARYGETGVNTFVIDVTGTVWAKDNGGRPVARHVDFDAEGWAPCGVEFGEGPIDSRSRR